jgi:site-specific DNA recombinase
LPRELWEQVQHRFRSFDGLHTQKRGLLPRSVTSPYLFSGLLKCGECGGNLIIATGGGTHRRPKYVCSNYFNRGVCANRLYIRRDHLEARLLGRIQSELLRPEVIEYAVSEFGRQLHAALGSLGGEIEQMRKRKEELDRKIQNLVSAIEDCGHSSALLQQLGQHQAEKDMITGRLLSATAGSIEQRLAENSRICRNRHQRSSRVAQSRCHAREGRDAKTPGRSPDDSNCGTKRTALRG